MRPSPFDFFTPKHAECRYIQSTPSIDEALSLSLSLSLSLFSLSLSHIPSAVLFVSPNRLHSRLSVHRLTPIVCIHVFTPVPVCPSTYPICALNVPRSVRLAHKQGPYGGPPQKALEPSSHFPLPTTHCNASSPPIHNFAKTLSFPSRASLTAKTFSSFPCACNIRKYQRLRPFSTRAHPFISSLALVTSSTNYMFQGFYSHKVHQENKM